MNDLFGGQDLPHFSSQEVRRSAKTDFRTSRAPIVKVRKCGAALLGPRSPEKCGKLSAPAHLTTGTRRQERNCGLREQQHSLQNEIELLEAELAGARATQEPFQRAFDRAHAELATLHEKRQHGAHITKPKMLAAYDKRVLAGHAWNPHKSKVRDLTMALKTYRQELKAVNQEIGI